MTTNARFTGQVNGASSTDNNILITGVQVEIGTFDANTIPPFPFEDAATSLARCQRYYHEFTAVLWGNMISNSGSYTYRRCSYDFPVTMRAIPTVSDILSTGITFTAQGQKETNCGFGTNSSVIGTTAYVGGAKFDAEL
jgi:hypothetical protein